MAEVIVDVTDEDIPSHRYLDDTDIEIPAACCSGKRGCCGISPGGAAPALHLGRQIQPIPSSDLDTAGTSGRLPRWNVLACGLRRWPAPFAPAPLQDLHCYYEAVRPSPAHRYFRPRGFSHLRLFPWHRRQGSHVPCKSLAGLRAAYTPAAVPAVSGISRTDPGSPPGFDSI
jgi:hypothetical protein